MREKIKNPSIRLKTSKKGFALLFSVLVSSLLLTIGLSVFSISLKELFISTVARQSIHAFYAADSGREHAIFQDTKEEGGGFFSTEEIEDLLLNNTPLIANYDGLVDSNETDGPNYSLKITKTRNDANSCDPKVICTTIISRGYDSYSGDRVERAIEQTY
jgi:hypothetical protein